MNVKRAIGAALFCGVSAFAARAESEWGGSFLLATDYVFRGRSQTQGEPAVQADLHWLGERGWLAGAWGSTVELHPGPGPTLELNGYLGHRWQLDEAWEAKLIAVHYLYDRNSQQLDWDYDELVASLGFRNALIATVAWSPNVSGFSSRGMAVDRTALSYELTAHLPLGSAWLASGGVGYYDLHDLFGSSYTSWNVGVSYGASPWQFTLGRFGTSGEAARLFGEKTTEDRWSLSLQWRFRDGQ